MRWDYRLLIIKFALQTYTNVMCRFGLDLVVRIAYIGRCAPHWMTSPPWGPTPYGEKPWPSGKWRHTLQWPILPIWR